MASTRFSKYGKAVVVFTLLVAYPIITYADAQPNGVTLATEELPARLLPEYLPCTYEKTRYACFDFEQMLQLNMLEVRARYWHDQLNLAKGLLENQANINLRLQDQIRLHLDSERQDQDQILVLNNKLSDAREDRDKWKEKAEDPPVWPVWLGATAALLGIGAFIGAMVR